MKKIKACPECGKEVTQKGIDLGYISGHDLGRPRGAKGVDNFVIVWICPDHGEVEPVDATQVEWWDGLVGTSIKVAWTGDPSEWIPEEKCPKQNQGENYGVDTLTINRQGQLVDCYGDVIVYLPKTDPGDLVSWVHDKMEKMAYDGE